MNSEPNNLMTKLIISKVNQLVDYIASLEPDLNEGELAAITAFLIGGLPEIIKSCNLEENIHQMAASLEKRQPPHTRNWSKKTKKPPKDLPIVVASGN